VEEGESALNTPKGLDLKAQGCREAATLGQERNRFFYPERVSSDATLSGNAVKDFMP
jgi:hypothetical protein